MSKQSKRDLHRFIEEQYLKLLRSCARVIAREFGLAYPKINLFDEDDPDRPGCRGMCFQAERLIILNLRKRTSRKLDTIESAMDTVIHELAHLRFINHDKSFWALHQKMKRWFYKELY